jgi:hypothetical protein
MEQASDGYQGEMGRILRLAECLESGECPGGAEVAAEIGKTPLALWAHQRPAFGWVRRIV